MMFIFVVYPVFKMARKTRSCDGDRMDLCFYTDHRDHICD